MRWDFFIFAIVIVVSAISKPVGRALAECKEPIPKLFQQVAPSVVYVSAISIDPFRMVNRIASSNGSGFIIDSQGLVLTNSHLVSDYRVIAVTLATGQIVPAELVGEDPVLDIAILRIPTPTGALPEVTLGDSKQAQVGEQVIAIGNPLGLAQTLTAGVISGINRILPAAPMSVKLALIQTDAAINPGSSGGPLVNLCGEVIGINTAVFLDAEDVGFALPINTAKEVLPQLLKEGRVIRPWVGVTGQLIGKELGEIIRLPIVDGFLVETVEPGSPAELAGLIGGVLPVTIAGRGLLLGGDIIVAGNGKSFAEPNNFVEFVRSMKVGDEVELTVFAQGETRQVNFRLSERPD